MNILKLVLSLFVFTSGMVVPTGPVTAQTTCNPELYFQATDPTTGNGISTAPQNGSIMFYLKVTPKGDCSKASMFIEKAVLNYSDGNKTVYVADFPALPRNAIPLGAPVETKFALQVSGLKDINTNQPVQVGGKLGFTAAIKLEGEPNFRSSSPVTVNVGNQVATPPTDQGTLNPGTINATIQNPIRFNSLGELIVAIIKFLLTMLGGLAVLFIIIGAVRMVTSAGNEKAVTAGKQTVTWAVIGLIVALMAFSFISLVQSVLQRK